MSNYGRESPSPEVKKGQWCEYCKREERIQNYMCQKNKQPYGTFLDPPDVSEHERKENQSYFVFKNEANHKGKTQYERLFNGNNSYDPMSHRDDRAHARSKGLNVNTEERTRRVPSLTSSNYGFRPPLEAPERKHVRVATVKSEFYNDNRIILDHK
jgi:hypothetical protein